MTAFEQFIAREYNRNEGDPIDDIYDEARARWKQMRTQPAEAFTPNAQAVLDPDAQTQQAQQMFASLSNNPDLPVGGAVDLTRNQRGSLSMPVQESYQGNFGNALLTPANQSIFDDLPDSGGLRQEQAREMEIAQRQASGASDAAQPQGLPPELVQTAWRMFADDYRDFSVRTDGPMKSEMRQSLVNDYSQGFAENYAPVLGVTLDEAQTIVDRAREENRTVQPSDWMGDPGTSSPEADPKQINEWISAAKGLHDLGRKKEAQELLARVGLTQPNDVFADSITLVAENEQLNRAMQAGRWTDPATGSVLQKDAIEARLAGNEGKLSGYSSALATYPTQEGRVVNANQELQKYTQEDGTILPSQLEKMNLELAKKAKETPGLMIIHEGLLAPAAGFKYEIPPDSEEAAPPEEKTTPELENIAMGVGRTARKAAPYVVPVAQTYLKAYLNVLESLPPRRAMREAEVLKKAVPYVRGAISGVKRGFSEQ